MLNTNEVVKIKNINRYSDINNSLRYEIIHISNIKEDNDKNQYIVKLNSIRNEKNRCLIEDKLYYINNTIYQIHNINNMYFNYNNYEDDIKLLSEYLWNYININDIKNEIKIGGGPSYTNVYNFVNYECHPNTLKIIALLNLIQRFSFGFNIPFIIDDINVNQLTRLNNIFTQNSTIEIKKLATLYNNPTTNYKKVEYYDCLKNPILYLTNHEKPLFRNLINFVYNVGILIINHNIFKTI